MGKKINFQPILSLQTNLAVGSSDRLVVVIDTRGPISINGKTTLFAISDISLSKSTYLDFENFNVVEFDQAANKYFIEGKVYLVLEKDVLTKTLLAEVKYDITKFKYDYPNEGLLVNDLNKRIKNDWNDSFNLALKSSFQSHAPVDRSTKETHRVVVSIFKNLNIESLKKNKTKAAVILLIAILSALNLSHLYSKSNLSHLYSKSNNQPQSATLLSSETMAQQQDELLNKAFSDIGIDRKKLSSDLSCFSE